MTSELTTSWALLVALGAFHGINPGMGWLFAVALGMQERRRGAVIRALVPLGVGHALAVAGAVGVAIAIGFAIPLSWLRWPIAGVLVLFGILRFVRHRHARWAGMRVGMFGLTAWSFLMATCHGAGLMVLPVFLGMVATAQGASCHVAAAPTTNAVTALTATLVHGAGYLLVTAAVAWVVYTKVGVAVLRKAWFNLDLIWAVALIATGILTVAA